MSSTDVPTLVCPKCGATSTTIMGSGNAACMACAYMWDPSDPAVPFVLAPAPFGMAPVDEVFDTSSHPANVPANLDLADHVGGRVVLEGGQEGFVLGVVDPETIEVILPDDRVEHVPLDVVVSMFPPPPVAPAPTSEDELGKLAPDLHLALDMARIIIRAGCESVHGTGETITPGLPPSGYLIDDPDVFPVVEQAAALAVGIILELLDADIDAVLLAVGAVGETAEPSEDF